MSVTIVQVISGQNNLALFLATGRAADGNVPVSGPGSGITPGHRRPGKQCWCATPRGKLTQFHSPGVYWAQSHTRKLSLSDSWAGLASWISWVHEPFFPLDNDQIQILFYISLIWIHRHLRIKLFQRVCSIATTLLHRNINRGKTLKYFSWNL